MRGPRFTRVGPFQALTLLACLALTAGTGLSSSAAPRAPRYAGMTLADALLELRSRGLKIVFTSELVTPELRVGVEPDATEPRRVLDALLDEHGLMARDGPRGTLVVVRRDPGAAAPPATVSGSVRSRRDGGPVAGATVRVLESGTRATSAADGTFLIPRHVAGSFTVVVGRAGFAIERVEGVALTAGRRTELSIRLDPVPLVEETVVVTPSRVSLLREEPAATLGFSREEIGALPHLGDDFFRAVSLAPGVTANDTSARFNVRGGRQDETQILLDGQELYEAYHLKDFDSALSFVPSSTLGSADLTTGGFPAEFGDRMAGVLNMTTVTPSGAPRGRLGASVLSLQAGGAGGFHDDRGSWLVQARRGTIDLVEKLLGDENPRYGDAYAKLDYQLDARNRLRLHVLYSDDEFRFSQTRPMESTRTDTDYRSLYFWLTHQAIHTDKLFAETSLSRTRIDQDRQGVELEDSVQFDVFDERTTEVIGLRQSWSLRATPRHLLRWGAEVRAFETVYDYVSSFVFADPLAGIRSSPTAGSTVFASRFEEEHTSLYLTDRMRPAGPVTLELGLRHDRHSLTDEAFVSPRVNLAVSPDEVSVVRVAWGRFNQSQRPYELQVEDGERRFYPTERSEHRVVGYERIFRRGAQAGSLALRAEVYQRRVRNPRPRFENLYEALNTFPELEPDRVRIAPERSVAQGVELFLQGRAGPRVGWFANYAWASTEDEIAGRDVPRKIDQRHALNLDLDWRIGGGWRLNVAWRYHSGWPTTALSLRQELDSMGQPVFVPELGPLNGLRLPDYHRLDVRASREFRAGGGTIVFFVDVQNLYNRDNIAGFDIDIDEQAGTLFADPEHWAGILPSFGVTYEF